ncbi:uncharacterized protein LOC142239944 [Haematobia irritans]|uniref:uncharacterized protein LOC142239944 n=1 Tax=Haematobia irritans TaxID=7368 RepID=UPI003F4FF031
MKENSVWELAPRTRDQKILKSKCVFRVKEDENVDRYKARLLAQGFLQNYFLMNLGFKRYSPLPQLYTFDDYDTCFSNGKSALSSTYCMVYAQVQPDNSSDLWKKIETHKLHRFNYHYDKLFFGVCLERCMHTMDIDAQKETLGIIDKEIVEDLQLIHKRPLDIEMRAKYSLMIQKCLNEEFQRKYDLKLNTFIEYCERPKETEQLEEDAAETILYKIINGLGLLVLFSSFYDYYLKTHPADGVYINEHFKNNYEDSVSRLLTSFSVPRNYNRLVQPYRGKIAIDFSYLDGLRSVSTLIVLHGHIFYMEFLHLQNPEYFENIVNSTIGLALHNLTPIIEIFMVMSGLLFYMKFKEMSIIKPQTSWGKCIKLLLLITVGRFLSKTYIFSNYDV